jgi:hypothetical protein
MSKQTVLRESDITAESLYNQRRLFMRSMGVAVGSIAYLAATAQRAFAADLLLKTTLLNHIQN